MTVLFLIRHAANDFVKEGKLAGWLPDVHINEEGRQQAEQLAARLEKVKLDAIYSSPLERAIETAEYLARPRELEIQVCPGLGELHLGAWEGHKIEELAKSDDWRKFQIYPSGSRPPNGETGREMQMRAVSEIEAICNAHPEGIVAVVSHSDPIKAIVAHYSGMHLDLFQRLVVSPASATVFLIGPWGPRLVRFNDAGPIDEIKPPQKPEQPSEQPEDPGKETEHAK